LAFLIKSPVALQPRQPQRAIFTKTRPEERRVLVRVPEQHGDERVRVRLLLFLLLVLVEIDVLARPARFQRREGVLRQRVERLLLVGLLLLVRTFLRGASRSRRGPNGLKLEKETTHVIVRWPRVVSVK